MTFAVFFVIGFGIGVSVEGGYLYGVEISYYDVMFVVVEVLIYEDFFEKRFCYVVSLRWGIYTYDVEGLAIDVYLNFGGFAFY